MRRIHFMAAAGVIAASVLVPTAAQADDDWPRPVCDHRVCLILVDEATDSDGDGYTDADEKAFGTDPGDPTSYPFATLVIDRALAGELDSFEQHHTELVVFPELTPALDAYASALGTIELPGKAWIDRSPETELARLQGNGLTGVDSVLAFVAPRESSLPGSDGKVWGNYMSLVAAGRTAYTDGTFSGEHHGTFSGGFSNEGTSKGSFHTDDGIVTAKFRHENRDYIDGKIVTETIVVGEATHDPATGEGKSTVTSTKTGYDKQGNSTGKTVTTTTVEVKDGQRYTTVKTVRVDEDGNEEEVESETTITPCPNNDCGKKYTDPDFVAVGPFTEQDLQRVMAKIDSVRTPGPDDGSLDARGDLKVPNRDVYALYSGDGIVVLGTEPDLFNRAQPEYGPVMRDLAPHAGTRFPLVEGDHYGRPGDLP